MSLLKRLTDMMRRSTTPLTVPRTMRTHAAWGMTSADAGKITPIIAVPLLREDAITSGRIRVNIGMEETAELLMNPIEVRAFAYFVPYLAFGRFLGSIDVLNASWEGQAFGGMAPVPYLEHERFDVGATGGGVANAPGKANPIMRALGEHAKDADMINTAYYEAYNLIVNDRLINRSKALPLRTRLQKDLAPAMWYHDNHKLILADYDQASMEGEVALNVTNGKMPVRNLGFRTDQDFNAAGATVRKVGGTTEVTSATAGQRWSNANQSAINVMVKESATQPGFPDVYAELAANGITVSLANIDLARETQAFAKLRKQYSGHTDEGLISMLMDGIQVPHQFLKQP